MSGIIAVLSLAYGLRNQSHISVERRMKRHSSPRHRSNWFYQTFSRAENLLHRLSVRILWCSRSSPIFLRVFYCLFEFVETLFLILRI